MKKILFTAVFLGFTLSVKGSPLMFEKIQAGQLSINYQDKDTLTVLTVSFSVDTSCYVQFTGGGLVQVAHVWLELDNDKLPPQWKTVSEPPQGFSEVYSCLLTNGDHEITLKFRNLGVGAYTATCSDAYLQALIFLPDSASASVSETHESKVPSSAGRSIISRGPYVSAPGASTVVDAAGRVMENVLSEGKVQISNLPAGTYYAKDEERTVVKIVKVD